MTMTTAAKIKTPRAPRKSAVLKLETEIQMPAAASLEDSLLGDLLDQLESVEADSNISADSGSGEIDELLEGLNDDTGVIQADAGAALGDDALTAAIEDVERQTARQAMYAEQKSTGIADGEAPATQPEDLIAAPVAKGKKAAVPKTPKEPKEPRASSVNTKAGDLLKIKLGEKWLDYLIFNNADATTLEQAGLEMKAQEFIDKMNDRDAIAGKVQEKAIMFLTWMARGGNLNEVLKRAITVLHEKDELTSGDKGNLQLNLLEKPYSTGTSRSQSNQVFMLFPILGLCVKEKGRMVPNPDSMLLPIAKQMLGLV